MGKSTFYNISQWQERTGWANSFLSISFQFVKLLNNSFNWCLFWNFWGFDCYKQMLFSTERALRYTLNSIWSLGKEKKKIPVKAYYLWYYFMRFTFPHYKGEPTLLITLLKRVNHQVLPDFFLFLLVTFWFQKVKTILLVSLKMSH